MSKQTVCDNDLCTAVYEACEDEQQLWWINLGWVESERYDACSVPCAMAVLDDMHHRQLEVEQAVEVDELLDA